MSVSRTKNFERRLDLLAKDAASELNKVCESSLWETLGFIYFDQLKEKEKIAKANFYYGQLQLIEELRSYF
tara:strand:- start:545 stop:757 length:213 start_codon:yes stop_codon:yes gene_type:complete